MTTLLFVRHGTHGLLGKRFVARTPGVLLNEEGWREAEAVADSLRDVEIAAIYSSPMERAMQTADPLAKQKNLEIQVREELNEIHIGEWSNLTMDELRQIPGWKEWHELRSCNTPPGGEKMLDVQHRMIAALEEIRCTHEGQTVAMFSHGDPIRAALAYYMGIPIDLFNRLRVDPGSISALEFGEHEVQLTRLNEAPFP
ncbi:MAG TPA: histidine phosphatase family protein [Fimbriimonadaceae bacterium]|nr:histidine phosphatase family protein [Fimbriimonadaceae bacterium]